MTSDYGFYSNQYVTRAHTACANRGCQYQESLRILAAAQEVLDQANRSKSMASEWCEIKTPELPDGHPFNGKNGKVVFDRTIYWPDGHMDSSGTITMCIKHGQETGLTPKDDIVDGEIAGEIANDHH